MRRRNGRVAAEVRFAQRAAFFGAVALSLFSGGFEWFLYAPRSVVTVSALVVFGAVVILGGYSALRWWREAKRNRPYGGPVPPELKYRLRTIWIAVLALTLVTFLVRQLVTAPASPMTAVLVVSILVAVLLDVRVAVKWRREANHHTHSDQ